MEAPISVLDKLLPAANVMAVTFAAGVQFAQLAENKREIQRLKSLVLRIKNTLGKHDIHVEDPEN